MGRRNKPRHDAKRGRHRKHVSVETRDWNQRHLIPNRPAWMSEETYHGLVRMRNEQERA